LLLCASILLHPALSAAQSPPPSPATQPPTSGAAPAPPVLSQPPGVYPLPGAYAPPGAYPPLGAYPPPGAYPPAGAYPYQVPPPPSGRMKTHSPALMGGGIALVALGGLSLLGAATAFVDDARSKGDFQGILSVIVGIPLLVHGLGCIAGGIPMIVIGKRRIPADGPPPTLSLVPSRGGGAMRWSF
jgi:hypothetical protein